MSLPPPLPSPVSIADRASAFEAGGAVVSVGFFGATAVYVLGEAEAVLRAPDGTLTRVGLHGGGILAAAFAKDRVVTAGDDGRVMALSADDKANVLATDPKRRWIDHVALAGDGTLAFSAGRDVTVLAAKGAPRHFESSSTPGGLAFAPKGLRLAMSHYNGATLWYPNLEKGAVETLSWKGSHHEVAFSPDGKFIVTSMLESTLHGWRLADQQHMRMSGYPGRVRSMAFTAGGRWLVTAGAAEAILWPFQSKDGPMGKPPHMVGRTTTRVTAVCVHPSAEVIAVGAEDGHVKMVRVEDGAEILVRLPTGAPVTALAFGEAGKRLAFGDEAGMAGVLSL